MTLLRLALRSTRRLGARGWILLLCLAVGVAGRVAVGTVLDAVDATLAREARALLGGDVEAQASRPFLPEQRAAILATLPAGSRSCAVQTLATMALAGDGRSRLVELQATPPGWPLEGRVRCSDGRDDLAALHAGDPQVYVQKDLLRQLGLEVGGRLRLGGLDARISGTIVSEPGLGADPFALGPRVLLGDRHLSATGLDTLGARIKHHLLALLPDPRQADQVARRLRRALGQAEDASPVALAGFGPATDEVRVRTAAEASTQAARLFARLADYARLLSLAALLLATLGVAGVLRGHLQREAGSLATLRALGLGPRGTVGLILLQAACAGLLGGILGVGLGAALAWLLVAAAGPWLPVAGTVFSAGACAAGLLVGLVAAIAAALPLALRRLRPAAIWRGELPELALDRDGLLALGAGLAALALLAASDTRSWLLGPACVAGLVLAGLLLAGLLALILPLAARLPLGGPALRLAWRNLARPGHRPVAAAAAVALAALLFGTLAIWRASLLGEFAGDRSDPPPSLYAIDLQRDQLDGFRRLCAAQGATAPFLAPWVKARYRGRPGESDDVRSASTREEEQARFFRSREQSLSWRERPDGSERIVAGRWLDPAGRGEASLERRFAERLGVGLGDRLRFEVMGEALELTVTSLRQVRWTSFRPNFFILVSPVEIPDAPQTWVAAVPTLPEAGRQRLQDACAAAYPGVSILDLAEVIARVQELIDRLGWTVRALAALALAAGLAVLGGLALATAQARRGEACLLRVLGGRRRQVLAGLAAEFALTGLLAGGLGLGLSLLPGWILTERVLQLPCLIPWAGLALLWLATAALCAGVGLAACRGAVTAPPGEVLRAE